MASNEKGRGTRRASALANLKGRIAFVSQKRCGRHVDETAEDLYEDGGGEGAGHQHA